MRRHQKIWLLAVVAIVAFAHDPASGRGQPGQPDDGSCYFREYGSAHLKKHPDQLVKRVRVLIQRSVGSGNAQQSYAMSIDVDIRGRSSTYSAVTECEWDEGWRFEEPLLSCAVECDGGGVGASFSDNKESLLLYLKQPEGLGRLVVGRSGHGCDRSTDPDTSFELTEESDDKVFKLFAVSPAECTPLKAYGISEPDSK